MLRRLVTGVAIVCFMGGAAYAQQDEEPVDSECAQQLTTAQETVQDKVDNNALSEDDQEKIYALMDEGEVLLKAGDVLIQRGTSHAWSNRTEQPCCVAFVLIDAEPV